MFERNKACTSMYIKKVKRRSREKRRDHVKFKRT